MTIDLSNPGAKTERLKTVLLEILALTKDSVGLSNVDNTADINKAISNLVLAALDAKQNELPVGTANQFIAGNHQIRSFSKELVGLNNVDNTSDEEKPVSIPTLEALALKLSADNNLSELSNANEARENLGLSPLAHTGNADFLVDGTVNATYTFVERAKLQKITVTGSINLDSVLARINSLSGVLVLFGTWDAAALNTFPADSNIKRGYVYIVSSAATIDGIEFNVGDRITALIDDPSTTVYAGNWFKEDYTDRVSSVAGQTGNVVLGVADLTDMSADGEALVKTNIAGMKTLLGINTDGTPSIAWADISNKPAFKTVATTGKFSDLDEKPTLGTASALDSGKTSGKIPALESTDKFDVAVIPVAAIVNSTEMNNKLSQFGNPLDVIMDLYPLI